MAHIRIPETVIRDEKAYKLFLERKIKNLNDKEIHEYFDDVVAIFNRAPLSCDENILNAIVYLKEKGVKI